MPQADDWILGATAAQGAYAPDEGDRNAQLLWQDPNAIAAARLRGPYANRQMSQGSAIPAIADAIASGVASDVMAPGQAMRANPYPPGTEEADWYDRQRFEGADKWARGMALNTMGTGAVMGVPVKGAEAVFGAGAVRRKASKADEIPKAPDNKSGTVPDNKPGTDLYDQGAIIRPNPIERYVTDPQRIYKPGIYKRPDVLAREAEAMVGPEHPAMKQLFGVTRGDLFDISQAGTRQGNVAPNIWTPSRMQGSYAAEAIMNPGNAQRLVDTIGEAQKNAPRLTQGMVPWYVMDPAFQRLVQLVGPERAVGEYNKFNSMMTPFSASSDVMKEINRGTGARMMAERGEFEKFRKFGGVAEENRGRDFPPELKDIISHPYHGIHTDPAGRFVLTGQHGYGKDTVKIPLYTQASGVPQTGFQTAWPVPDAHFTRAAGMSDVRKNASPGDYMGGSEYRTFAPWFREHVAAPSGIEAVPTQALMWGAYAPQTGVKTAIGAPKLELISQRMWERARELGVNPQDFRDQVLLGQQHSALEDDSGRMYG